MYEIDEKNVTKVDNFRKEYGTIIKLMIINMALPVSFSIKFTESLRDQVLAALVITPDQNFELLVADIVKSAILHIYDRDENPNNTTVHDFEN